MIRWFLGLLGLSFFRWPGAILGFVIGSIIDNMNAGKSYQSAGRFFGNTASPPADFELKLLSLASLVIKADGKVQQSELDFVRRYFITAYGQERANAAFKTFNEEVKKTGVSPNDICQTFKQVLRYESRLQVLHFLFSIANADGHVSDTEVSTILRIAQLLNIQSRDFESIKAMFFQQPDRPYTILEIDPKASDDEVKKAYRSMVKKYHPDKLQHMDEAYRKGAEEKFRNVREAYEQIQKERGL